MHTVATETSGAASSFTLLKPKSDRRATKPLRPAKAKMRDFSFTTKLPDIVHANTQDARDVLGADQLTWLPRRGSFADQVDDPVGDGLDQVRIDCLKSPGHRAPNLVLTVGCSDVGIP
jgi:hypothetical protein